MHCIQSVLTNEKPSRTWDPGLGRGAYHAHHLPVGAGIFLMRHCLRMGSPADPCPPLLNSASSELQATGTQVPTWGGGGGAGTRQPKTSRHSDAPQVARRVALGS